MAATASFLTAAVPTPPTGAGFDCQKARAPDERLVCASPELAALDRRMTVLFSWDVASREEKERPARRTAQRAWLGKRATCAAGPGVATEDAERVACVRAAYQERIAELERAAGPVPDAVLVLRRDRPARKKQCEEVDVSWPELQSTSLPGAAAFNAFFAEKPHVPECVDPAELPDADGLSYSREFSLLWSSSRFVSVARTTRYSDPRTPHPNRDSELTTFDLEEGRPVGPDDVLTADRASRKELAALLVKKLSQAGKRPKAEAVFDDAFTARHWAFTGAGARVHFAPYEIADYSQGDFDASFTWDELRPFLAPGAVLPGRP